MITGQYDVDGYTVFQDHRILYTAGNSPFDSQQSVDPADALSIGILAMYCHDTMVKLAEDRHDTVGVCLRVF